MARLSLQEQADIRPQGPQGHEHQGQHASQGEIFWSKAALDRLFVRLAQTELVLSGTKRL